MFHLAFPVVNIEETIDFYLNTLKASLGRSASNWADFNLYGHQITAQENKAFTKRVPVISTEGIPINHFGVILKLADWNTLRDNLIKSSVNFLIEPKVVFEGEVGEQYSFFIKDPNGYAIEFKGFNDLNGVFLK
jgi:hypothetical protein